MQAGTLVSHLPIAIGARTEDEALVAALKAGSEEAFAVLIAQYSQPLYSLIVRSLQDPADAADVTQEVFLKVFRSIRTFHGDSSLRTWLYRIALRESSNQRRWWTRHKKHDSSLDAPAGLGEDGTEGISLAATLRDPGYSPCDKALRSELRHHVESALRELPEAFRAVVVLRELEGMAYEEIAEILEVPAGTVKSRLTRGRAALKQLLMAQGLGPMLVYRPEADIAGGEGR